MAPSKPNTKSQKQKAQSGSKSRPGLALIAESPVRTLTSFTGFQTSPKANLSRNDAVNTAGSSKNLFLNEAKSSADSREKEKKSQDPQRHSEQDQMWIDRYTPSSRADLAIHDRKIKQVEGWLSEALEGSQRIRKFRRILVLSGPAGSGKSALIRTLAHPSVLNFSIVEWSNHAKSSSFATSNWDYGRNSDHTFGFDTVLRNHFRAFLSQSSRFSTLEVEEEESRISIGTRKADSLDNLRRVILIDDLPNIYHEQTRIDFQEAIFEFINSPHRDNSIPLIIILSDATPRLDDWSTSNTMQGWKERNEESLNVRNVLPETVRLHPAFAHISFNPVAHTILSRAVFRILAAEQKRGLVGMQGMNEKSLKQLAATVASMSNGDIRSAINSAQISLNSKERVISSKGIKRTATGKNKAQNDTSSLAKSISIATGREVSLSTFHVVGKILYNKRIGDPQKGGKKEIDSESEEEEEELKDNEVNTAMKKFMNEFDKDVNFELPGHLQHLNRRKSRVNVEKMWRSMPMDNDTLQLFLHQNYVPFCDDVDQCNALVDHLSCADVIKPSHESWFHSSLSQYYSFLIAAYGSLMSLPSPMPQGKERSFRGSLAFIESGRKLRKNKDSLAEIKAALNKNYQNLPQQSARIEEESMRSAISETGLDQMACEILPLVSKCRTLPEEIKECVEMDLNWGRGNTVETTNFTGWNQRDSYIVKEELDDIVVDEDGLPSFAESQLYDKEGKRIEVEMIYDDDDKIGGTKKQLPDFITLDTFELLGGQGGEKEHVQSDNEEDDEIEDFD